MSRRAVVLILAGVIAAAVAIPALADPGPTAQSASVKGLSKRALAKAKNSLRQARKAKRTASRAVRTANDAEDAANAAQGAATAAQGSAANALKAATSASEKAGGAELNAKEAKAEVAATRPKIGLAEGAVSTEKEDEFVKLDGGPSVTVTVPPTGLVQVWGSALIDGGAGGEADGAVSLYEDGQQVAGQAGETCGIKGVLFSGGSLSPEPELVGTPATPSFAGICGTLGAPGPVLFRSTAGEHTFELRYASCSCTGSPEKVTFSQRRLIVAPLP